MAELTAEERQPLEGPVEVDSVPTLATLTSDGTILWKDASGCNRRLVVEREVLGVDVGATRIVIRALVEVGNPSCLACGDGDKGTLSRRDHVLQFPSDADKDPWALRLTRYIQSLGRPKKLFIFLNPYGGKKRARNIFENEVKPLLEAANVSYTLQETQYQLHAQQLANAMDLVLYDGIICMGGDGTVVEVLNGLLQRDDWRSAIKMPLGIIPAGSGNGMIKSLLDDAGHACSVSNAVLTVIRGHRRSLDVATISQGKTLFFSALMICWGLVADIDIESEKFRWMGGARFDFYPLLRVISLRRYNGHVSFVPASDYEAHEETGEHSSNNGLVDVGNAPHQGGYQGPLKSFKSTEWKSIEGPFVSVLLHNVPWINMGAIAAPEAKFSDGCYDMIIIKDCPRFALLQVLLAMIDGSYVKSPYVEYIKVKAFRLEPGHLVGEPTKGGIVDSDGEVLARGNGTYLCDDQSDPMMYGPPIEMQVEKGLATVFCPLPV